MSSTLRTPSAPPARAWAPVAFVALLLAASASPAAAQASDDNTLFARPYIIRRLEADPWMGGVWIATDGGLFFKDLQGGGLRLYSVSNGLPSPVVEDVAVGATQVWVGTQAGVAVLDKSAQSFLPVRNPDGSSFVYSTRTLLLEGDQAWLGTDSMGLYRVDGATLAAQPVPNPVDGSTFTHAIYGLGALGPELYISAVGYGLVRWDRDTGESRKFDYTYNQEDPYYLRLAVSPYAVWVGTDGDGVMRLTRHDWTLREYASPQTVNALTVLRPIVVGDTVWMATKTGITRHEPASDTWRYWGEVPAGDVADSANDVALVEGEVYAGTAFGKIARFDRATQTWQQVDWWDLAHMPRHNVIFSCAVDDGRLLFGTGGGGANFYDPQSGLWSRAGTEPGETEGPRDIGIWDAVGADGKRYFSHGRGVSEVDKATQQYVHYFTDGRVGEGRGGSHVKDIAIDGGTAWFATYASKPYTKEGNIWNPGGVARMDRQTHAIQFYGEAAGLADGNVSRVAPDGGRVWVAMEKGGLDVLDKATGRIDHVWPPSGQGLVNDILVRPDGVWLAAGTDGVLRVDPATLAVTKLPILPNVAVWRLLEHEGTVWAGSVFKGIHAIDPQTLATQSYGTGKVVDYMANCMVVHDGLLYVGTNWGVERFDLAARTFLQQVGRLGSAATSASIASASISIDAPAAGATVEPGAQVRLEGRASGPAGSRVLVRVGDGPWQPATGLQSWSAGLDLPDAVGLVTLTARLESEGRTLAQAARQVGVGVAATGQAAATLATAAASLRHTPVLEAAIGESPTFTVDGAAGLAGLEARLEIRLPGAPAFEGIPMQAGGSAGQLVAQVPPLPAAGLAEYRIVLEWEGGSARLPAAFSGFGPTYQLLVRGLGGQSAAVFPGETAFSLPTQGPGRVELVVQNPGTRASLYDVELSGIPAAWVTEAPEQLQVPAASSAALVLELQVPEGQKAGRYALDVALVPPVQDGTGAQVRLTLGVGGVSLAGDAEKGVPLPAWTVLAALALAAAALARRR